MLRQGPMIDTHRVTLAAEDDFDGWRRAARDLVAAGVPPEAIVWCVEGGEPDLFGKEVGDPGDTPAFAVPRAFVDLARTVACHSDPRRFALLYELLWRLRSHRHALEDDADPLVRRLQLLAKEVRRDAHKMHAFVRFREMAEADVESRFVAWFEPEHHIVRREAGFFVRRFANMHWSILTPELCIHWDGHMLSESPGARRQDAPSGDPLEETWKTYYASIFNPARLKVKAMTKEMPKKYWRNLPESALIGPLIATARERELEMIERSKADRARLSAVPTPGGNLEAAWKDLLAEANKCTRCDLFRCASQTVFGEGPLDAKILFVGEQPGDQEDLAGRPFVGPAGQLFDQVLTEAGIDRSQTYVTNAVKHFKFIQRGKRRIHQTPDAGEIQACRWWLEQERELIRPPVTVALGATAGRSLFGKAVTISRLRGEPQQLPDGGECWVTVHPSYLLRIPEAERRRDERARFVEDMRNIKRRAAALAA